MTTLLMESEVETRVVTEETVRTSNDKPTAAHIVRSPNADETNHAYVMRARIEGFPVTALCGYVWVPSKQATGLPVCQECKAIWDAWPHGDDDNGQFPRE